MTLLAILLPGIAGLAAWYWAGQRWSRNEPAAIAGGTALAVLLLVLMGSIWIRGRALEQTRQELRAASLVRDSLEAAADTLRHHYLAADSSRVVAERRALQAALERDSVDQLLRTESRARARIEAQVAELHVGAAAVAVVDSADVRHVAWDLRQEPYTIAAAAEVPPPPAMATLALRIRMDPLSLVVGFRCGEPGATGIRPAHVTADVPDWLPVTDVVGQMDADLCNPPPPPPPSLLKRIRIGAPYAAGGFIAGAVGALILTR